MPIAPETSGARAEEGLRDACLCQHGRQAHFLASGALLNRRVHHSGLPENKVMCDQEATPTTSPWVVQVAAPEDRVALLREIEGRYVRELVCIPPPLREEVCEAEEADSREEETGGVN